MDWKTDIAHLEWREGKVFILPPVSYRHRMVVTCSVHGRQTTQFLNGEYNYSVHMELVDGSGVWSPEGCNVVPVLPDGRIIMVVEQRPAHYRWNNHPPLIKLASGDLDLSQYGRYSSLEFPGGSFLPGEGFTSGTLRELLEETGVEQQSAELFLRRVIDQSGADMMKRSYPAVIFLQGQGFQSFVHADGGLNVLAMDTEEVQENFYLGNITSGQAAVMPWDFYREVAHALRNSHTMRRMEESGYFIREQIHIK